MAALKFKELGNAKYKEGKYEDAVEAYGQAIEDDPTVAAYYTNRSAAFMMLKKFDEAFGDSKKAMEVDPAFVKGYIRGAKCQLQQGKLREAQMVLDDCLRTNPESPDAVKELETIKAVQLDWEKARELLGKSDFDRASYFIDRINPLCPDAPELMRMRADMLIGRGKYDDAVSITFLLLSRDRQNPDLLFLRGKALLYSGATDQAIKHLEEALRNDPDHRRARELRKLFKAMEKAKTEGNEFFKIGKCPEAIEAYTTALGMDPLNTTFNSTVYCNRAAAKMRKKDFKVALEDCDEALKLNADYVKAISRRAECLMQLEEYEESVREYERACQLDQDNRDLKLRLRDAKLELKKSKRKNYYKILEVAKDAQDHDIKKAYKRAALKWHPDKWCNGTDEEQEAAEKAFKDVGEAYSVLTDDQKRRRYDAGQDLEEIEGGGGGGCGGHGDHMDIFEMMFKQGGMGGGMGGPGGMRFQHQHQ
mmetsp:Transcript_34841/g.56266  ORF Transcript_34841/g.56266 Transcript_34841/m.56266 type:complete len:477 (+) Transcript_34841:222-1652(+)